MSSGSDSRVYEGGRGLDGAVVTVDGDALDPRYDVKTFCRTGFEWTYVGDGPRQLALALLADHLGNAARALGSHGSIHAHCGRGAGQCLAHDQRRD